ncbi:MAG: hypothetical protein B6226_04420 [Candidatus Cloacimonetes bacterium 4572_65]|nr:MAG: hypothetical protein B6226_04420 [Candidatus Cloacimonetes bacterium 4572_65]
MNILNWKIIIKRGNVKKYIVIIILVVLTLTGCTTLNNLTLETEANFIGNSSSNGGSLGSGTHTKKRDDVDVMQDMEEDLSLYLGMIDSLYTEIEDKEEFINSLLSEIEDLRSNIIAVDVGFPDSILFAGQVIDLTKERNLERFEKVYKSELKSAFKFIPRSGKYFAIMDSIFTERNIPLDTKYLAIAESRLSYRAHSSMGADGIWQIMPITGKHYKMQIDEFIDERRDIYKSTEVAARLLNDTFRYFRKKGSEDWLLSYCAYNAGMGNVNKVLKAQGGTKFSELIFKTEETNQYVWKAIAIKYIMQNEEKIFSKRFKREESLLKVTKVKNVKLNGHYKIDAWAKAQGTSIGIIYELNPWIKIYRQRRKKYSAINDVVLPAGTHNILVPINSVKDSTLVASIEKTFLNKNAGFFTHHTVKSGDNLYNIARKYKTTVPKIKSLNGMSSNMIRPGQKLKLYGNVTNYSNKTYVVKRGDSLSVIGKRLNIKVKTLIAKNKLKKNKKGVVLIYPGQKLYY